MHYEISYTVNVAQLAIIVLLALLIGVLIDRL